MGFQLRAGIRVLSALLSLTQSLSSDRSGSHPAAFFSRPLRACGAFSPVIPTQACSLSTLTTPGFCQSLGDIGNFASPSKSPWPYHISFCLEKQTLLPLLVMVSLGLSRGNGVPTCPCPPPGHPLRLHVYGFLEAVLSKASLLSVGAVTVLSRHCLFFFQYFHVPDSTTFSICPGREQPATKSSSLPCWDLMPDVSQSPLDASLLQKQILLAFSPASGASGSQCWSLPAIVRHEFPRQSVAVPVGSCGENGFCTRYFTSV